MFNGTGRDPEDGILTNFSLVWYSDINGVIGAGERFSTANLSAGAHSITLMVNDSVELSDTDSVMITVVNRIIPPVASFIHSPENPVVSQTITFDASSSYDPDGKITIYKWHFGDGNVTNTTETTIAHSYSTAGNYTVQLTVTDNEGATNTCMARITVSNMSDLVITDTWVNLPDNCTICYNVTNSGNGTAQKCHNTTLYVEGVEVACDLVPVSLALIHAIQAVSKAITGCTYRWRIT